MPRLTEAESNDFLAEGGHLLRLATVDADGMPRLSPVWFIHDVAASEVLFTPRAQSVFLANLRRDPRLALVIDEEALPYRKVSVQGRAVIRHELGEDDVWRETYRSIAERYISAEAADRYITDTIDQPRALIAVPLGVATVSSWRMPVAGESGTGIWARRYYGEGTFMADRADESYG